MEALSSRFSNTMVGFLVMIPNLAGLLLMIGISRSSDRTQERRWHIAVPAFVGGLACLSLGATHSVILSIAPLALFAGGFYGAVAPFWALAGGFLSRSS